MLQDHRKRKTRFAPACLFLNPRHSHIGLLADSLPALPVYVSTPNPGRTDEILWGTKHMARKHHGEADWDQLAKRAERSLDRFNARRNDRGHGTALASDKRTDKSRSDYEPDSTDLAMIHSARITPNAYRDGCLSEALARLSGQTQAREAAAKLRRS